VDGDKDNSSPEDPIDYTLVIKEVLSKLNFEEITMKTKVQII
jgi:hypothetical protein